MSRQCRYRATAVPRRPCAPRVLILTVGFTIAGVAVLWNTRRSPNTAEEVLALGGLLRYVGLLVIGAGLCYALQPLSELASNIVRALIFVAVLEELFFRGYVLTRLNDVFGRRYVLFNVNYGAGLLVAALVFGAFHPLSVVGQNPWPWALWTGVMGLVFGFLREKSGAVVASSLVHGVILIPGVLFGGV